MEAACLRFQKRFLMNTHKRLHFRTTTPALRSVHVSGLDCKTSFLPLPCSIDVTEVQIFIIILYLLAAVGGAAFWQSPVSLTSANSHTHTLTNVHCCFHFNLEFYE